MDIDPEMRQRLLELVYDLLPEDEAAELRSRIVSDPDLARAYAQADGAARVFAAGARLEAAKIELQRPSMSAAAPVRAKAARAKGGRGQSSVSSLTRGANWAVGVASVVLLAVSVGGYFWQRGPLAHIGTGQLRLMVAGPARLYAGVAQEYTVAATSATGTPVSARVDFAFFPPNGTRKARVEKTDELEQLRITIPADQIVPGEGRIEVWADHEGQVAQVSTPVTIKPARYITELVLDKCLYEPGETVRYRSLTLSQSALAADREAMIHFEVLDPSGAVVPGSQLDGITRGGVGCGQFLLPANLTEGRYVLAAKSAEGSFPRQRGMFQVRSRASLPPKTDAKPSPGEPGKVDVGFHPEGGNLAAGMENRVYFTARDAQGRSLALSGRIVDGRNRNMGRIETEYAGMGSFVFQPRAGEQYRLRIDKPADVKIEPNLPEASAGNQVVLTTGLGVFDAGRPLEFNVRSAEPGLPLVVSAWCRGVPVGQQVLVTEADANSIAIPLADEVVGVIRLVVYDYRFSPPRPVAERLVYRRPARRLRVRLLDPPPRYLPGKPASLSLAIVDETGKPTKATLGIAVVDSACLQPAGNCSSSMSARFLLTEETEKPETLEKADTYLANDPKGAAALDMLLGTQGWRRFAEKTVAELHKEGRSNDLSARLTALGGDAIPPAVFDNLHEIRAKHQGGTSSYRTQGAAVLNVLTMTSLFGGAGLILLVTMLAIMNIASGVRLWTLSFATTATCLVLGAMLMNPERSKSANHGAVAFTPYSPAPGEAAASAGKSKETVENSAQGVKGLVNRPFPVQEYARSSKSVAEDPPGHPAGVLFWHPMLQTDGAGRAQVRVDLPDRPGTFCLLVDAIGSSGRLGSLRVETVSGNPPGKP